MRIKFITETETLLDEDFLTGKNADENQDKLDQFKDREVISTLIEFEPGVKAKYVNIPELTGVKQITVKVK